MGKARVLQHLAKATVYGVGVATGQSAAGGESGRQAGLSRVSEISEVIIRPNNQPGLSPTTGDFWAFGSASGWSLRGLK